MSPAQALALDVDKAARDNGSPGPSGWWDPLVARSWGSRWATRERVLRHLRDRAKLP